jgi:pimeloyl-ACP methyl ester carboxylesterase
MFRNRDVMRAILPFLSFMTACSTSTSRIDQRMAAERVVTSAPGIQIRYDDIGSGEPALLLLPGWSSSRRVFAPLLAPLSTGHRVLAVDWRGHGESTRNVPDFGFPQLVEDALAVVKASGARAVVPVAVSHAGWAAIDLRKELGDRVPKVVFLDWIILDPPPPFLDALTALQAESAWRGVRDRLFSMWLANTGNEALARFLSTDMGEYDFAMWARAGREIGTAYRQNGNPLKALSQLRPPVPTLHVYAQPDDPAYLEAQESFAKENPWFHVVKLRARTHFPMFEVPMDLANAINSFVGSDRYLGSK